MRPCRGSFLFYLALIITQGCVTLDYTGYFKASKDGNYKILVHPDSDNKAMKFHRTAFEICKSKHNKGVKIIDNTKKSLASEGMTRFGLGYYQNVYMGSVVCKGAVDLEDQKIYEKAKGKFTYKPYTHSGTSKWGEYYNGGFKYHYERP